MTWSVLKGLQKQQYALQDAKEAFDKAETLPEKAEILVDTYDAERNDGGYWNAKPREMGIGKFIFEAKDADLEKAIITVGFKRLIRKSNWPLEELVMSLMARKQTWTAQELEPLVVAAAESGAHYTGLWSPLLRHLRRFIENGGALTPEITRLLKEKQKALTELRTAEATKLYVVIGELFGDDSSAAPEPGEPWADLALKDLDAMPESERKAWLRLFGHMQTADGGKPSAVWRKEAAARASALPGDGFAPRAIRWLEAVTTPSMGKYIHSYSDVPAIPLADGGGIMQPRGPETYTTHVSSGSDRNVTLLKGLAWTCVDYDRPNVARALGKLTESCLKKQPGVGPWAIRAASAAVWALSEMSCPESAAVLSRLKTRLTYRATLTQVEKALEQTAQRLGVTKQDLEDMSVPTYGLDSNGKRREEFGEYAAEMALTKGGEIMLTIFGPGGKTLKSVPTAIKQAENADDWKALKADADAAGKTLSAQKQRFDGFALEGRVWILGVWKERFLEHPLLGSIARHLIWRITQEGHTTDGLWDDGTQSFQDSEGQAIPKLTDEAEVRLWHPVQSPVEEVVRWRNLLEARQIRQPFKQAHREVYLLTAAEEDTRTYSNRYAGHILKQHQFAQLAALRGWKNQLRLMVDDSYEPARRELPQYNLRAEFWVEGIGDNYGTDTTDAGTYLYLTTDQVRFYPLDARANFAHAGGGGYGPQIWHGATGRVVDPLPLSEIDPLAFSEILRDIDLFVGVASVGNDPTWADGGPGGRHRGYWQDYSFGELSATAQTRRDVLVKLLPRLKIRDRASLDGRFLVVRGDLRTYKIHLGSGNILMEPNDQYLCIVQDRSVKDETTGGNLFLPFEGDQRLSLILSKAMLLADDKKITDPTITRQIGAK